MSQGIPSMTGRETRSGTTVAKLIQPADRLQPVFARCARNLTARRNGRAVEHAVERAGSSNNIAEMALSLSCHLFFPRIRLRADLTKSKNYGDDGAVFGTYLSNAVLSRAGG